MHISIGLFALLLLAAVAAGAFFAWNNGKSSVKAKLDAEIGKATGAASQALTTFKGKL